MWMILYFAGSVFYQNILLSLAHGNSYSMVSDMLSVETNNIEIFCHFSLSATEKFC